MLGKDLDARGPLAAYPQIRTREVSELEASVAPIYGSINIDIDRRNGVFDVYANHCQLDHIGITYARMGADISLELPSIEAFATLFSYSGAAQVAVGATSIDVNGRNAFVASVDQLVRLHYTPHFHQLVLRVHSPSLRSKVEALLGEPMTKRLEFAPASTFENEAVSALRSATQRMIELIDSGLPLRSIAMIEAEEILMLGFLRANANSFTDRLVRTTFRPLPSELRRAEDYMEANWDQPITVETLAAATGISARTIFHHFQARRGYSPKDFLRRIRLERAHRLLSRPDPATSVTDVAFACGFGNLGHFANYYLQHFGERPSDTLRRATGTIGRKRL